MKETTLADRPHSTVVGGSTALRRLECPASLKIEMAAPPSPGSAAASRGSALHYLLERALRDGAPLPDGPVTVELDREGPVPLSGDDVAIAHRSLAAWRRFQASVEAEIVAVEGNYEFPGIPGAHGTADIVWRADDRWGVWDWKFGSHRVEARENAQLLFYATAARVALANVLPTDGAVSLAIYQPALSSLPDIWTTDPQSLDAFAERLRGAIEDGLSETPRVNPGPWCQWARCQNSCPLRRQQAAKLAAAFAAVART